MTITTLKRDSRLSSLAAAKLETGSTEGAGARSETAEGAIINLQDLVNISSPGNHMQVSAMEKLQPRGVEFATVRPSLTSTIDGN